MQEKVLGLHHVTAIADEAQTNYNFYTKVLGLRLIKKTVNFDDPGTYHFYYGDEKGTPGTILTFFPWEGARPGEIGVGMATEISYNVPEGSFEFWMERFKRFNVKYETPVEQFGQQLLKFKDPDGLNLIFIENANDNRKPWESGDVTSQVATRGFHSVTLNVKSAPVSAWVLTDILGYEMTGKEGNRTRFITHAVDQANILDLTESPYKSPGIGSAGTTHHVAFRVKDENILMEMREKVLSRDYSITTKIDRNYFYSLYFREPGGILFEFATENPGFAIDEPVNELGTHLKLPPQYEVNRKEIEDMLQELK